MTPLAALQAFLVEPNMAYILLLIGIYGIIFEFAHPGSFLPGTVGAICLVLACYAMHLLPISYTGLALLLLGIIFMLSEMHVTSYGILGITGVIAFFIGSTMLFQSNDPALRLSLALIITMSTITAGFFLAIFMVTIRALKKPVVTGQEALIGSIGIVTDVNEQRILINLNGEIWQARSPYYLQKGQRVSVIKADGLFLVIEPINKETPSCL